MIIIIVNSYAYLYTIPIVLLLALQNTSKQSVEFVENCQATLDNFLKLMHEETCVLTTAK